jgi:hypothetical protein
MTARRPYLCGVSSFFSRLSPLRAIRDLRVFLSYRRPHELGFLVLAVVMTTLIIAGFVKDSNIPRTYQREIVYVENWRADRSIDEIRARLAKDAPIEAERRAELKRRQEALKAEFKKYDDTLTKWGL